MSIYFIFIFLMAFLYDAYLIKKTCPPKIWLLCLYWSIVILLIGTRDVVIDTINPKYLNLIFANILRVLLLIIIPFYSFVCAKRYFCKRKLLIPVIILIPYIHYFIYEILYYLIYNYYY